MPKFPAVLAVSLILVGGCSSVSVDRVQAPVTTVSAPARIYVQSFLAPAGVFRVDRNAEGSEKFRAAISRQLAEATALRIGRRLAPAVAIGGDVTPPREAAWLVTGRFVRVNQGSRVLRTALGFGLGATKLETEVIVYDLAGPVPRPILTFVTTGGSNAGPGVVVGAALPNFWLMGLDALVKMGPGLSNDMIRTSRQIVAVLSQYMAREGFVPPEKIKRAKQLGKWP